MTARGWALLLAFTSACSIDLIEPGSDAGPGGANVGGQTTGRGGDGGEGAEAPSTSNGPGGAPPDGPGPGPGGTGGEGGGLVPPCDVVATFDGLNDQLTIQPPGTDMTSATEFGFSVWLDPDAEAHGQMFVAGRSFENQNQGWMLVMVEDQNEWIVRLRVHQGAGNTCYVDAYVPKDLFPLTAHAHAYPGGYLTMDIDDDSVTEYQCEQESYSTVTSVNAPFRLGYNSFLAQYTAFRGSLDDVFWFADAEAENVCDGQEGDYGWNFDSANGQMVDPVGICAGLLLLGTSGAEEESDPLLGCGSP